ncbi:hypothetical protein A1O3_06527 [Capronia epimyces CBS 606.96]|uniref:AMP-dependent synthetase/ligase domain-containing protein n=1 Tax=Capronia epimyces CBS 606.96 TaxID=1182542 RepID=W9XR55_9EURO|nr:uncharacterized protein A1O3_06527 [Capronia epimyces CBS 606.96]EXJ82713.1 hypothetical protein A1O3_06527 [Capronia epimyces CBS 606.96]
MTQQEVTMHGRLAIHADGQFTYDELHCAALRLAAVLHNNHVAVEERIPLCMRKSKWTIAAIYKPPPKRLLALTERLDARLVVTDQTMSTVFIPSGLTIVTYRSGVPRVPESRLALGKLSASAAAFIYFTSGSTGTPKGVVLEHGNLYAAIREVTKTREIQVHCDGEPLLTGAWY